MIGLRVLMHEATETMGWSLRYSGSAVPAQISGSGAEPGS